MEQPDITRAIGAATSIAASLGLAANDAMVLHNSNKLTLRMTPCDSVARVTVGEHEAARLELERARALAVAGCPVGTADPRVDPLVYTDDGFAVTLWAHHEPAMTPLSPVEYASALALLHSGMRTVDLASPRFTDRVADAQQIAADPDLSPELTAQDRELLTNRLAGLRRILGSEPGAEQLLHGEPHPGNVLATTNGAVFIDFETLCRGPVEFDLAHVPESVCEHYPGINQELLDECRQLVLAMVAAWRWRVGDQFPNRRQWGHGLLRALREGPPWPTIDALTKRF
ncbi:MAG: aminoglycoside phosphotransferase family protein [Microlunatus sp.]